jgi:hypothetical protein
MVLVKRTGKFAVFYVFERNYNGPLDSRYFFNVTFNHIKQATEGTRHYLAPRRRYYLVHHRRSATIANFNSSPFCDDPLHLTISSRPFTQVLILNLSDPKAICP